MGKGRKPHVPQRSPEEASALALEHDRLAYHTLRTLPWAVVCRLGGDEECLQIARLALLRAAALFRPDMGFAFSTYACKAMQHALQVARSRRPVIRGPINRVAASGPVPSVRRFRPVDKEDTGALMSRYPAPAEVAERNERVALVRRAVKRLPGRQRRVVQMHMTGKENTEIGKVLGISKQAVWQIRKRAFARLRLELGALACA